MNKFSLSYSKEKVFPGRVKDAAGEYYVINADFRNILKIIRLFGDSKVLDAQKYLLGCKWFYADGMPDISEAVTLMTKFMYRHEKGGDEGKKTPPQFDYEFDAEEIYTSFLLDYKVDLVEVDFLHWYKFQIMLMNLSAESPFFNKIKLRFADLKDYKGDSLAKVTRAKRMVQLPVKYSAEEEKRLRDVMSKLR